MDSFKALLLILRHKHGWGEAGFFLSWAELKCRADIWRWTGIFCLRDVMNFIKALLHFIGISTHLIFLFFATIITWPLYLITLLYKKVF